ALLLASAVHADISGNVAEHACGALVLDNRARAGELYVIKTHNAGGGPDQHMDWLFDLSGKTGAAITASDIGGAGWRVPDTFKHPTVPPEEAFAFVTYPDGWLALDSTSMRGGGDDLGLVQ